MPPNQVAPPTDAKLAATFVRNFGAQAAAMLRERAEQAEQEPQAAARWRELARLAEALSNVQELLEQALLLLDQTGDTHVAAHLDLAMVHLGLRESPATKAGYAQPAGFVKGQPPSAVSR